MKRTKIQSVEEALKTIEESAILRGIATINGDSKTGNKYVPIQNKALVYLYEHNSLASLQPLLSHGDFNVRLYAAYALLPLFETKCKNVLLNIANGDYKIYGIQGLNAEMTLKAWERGELIYPYQSGYGKIPIPNKEDSPSNKADYIDKTRRDKKFSPEILRLSRIFECPPIGNFDLRNEQLGFFVMFDSGKKEFVIRINTFVNPYTQDIATVYQERLNRFKGFEHVATISADEPSKLGYMQIRLTIQEYKATDDVLLRIKDIIYEIYNEWKPNESLVWFKVEYNDAICFFESEWWCPTRAVIKGRCEYERYEFSNELKFDEKMWEIVKGEFDQFEYSDSFALIDREEFLLIWNKTKRCYTH